MDRKFNIFNELSKRTGVDFDKVIFEKAEEEIKKLDKNMRKETMKERTRIINKRD